MNFLSLDLNLLRVLDALLSEGSTVAAGRKIGLSQPAVSAALGRLRHSLNDPLFVRSGQGLEPTEFARSIAEPLSGALSSLERILEPKRFDPQIATATFVVATTDFFSVYMIPRVAKILTQTAPGIRVKILEPQGGSYSADLKSGNADIALVPDVDLPDFIETRFLFESESVVVARRGNRRLETAGVSPGGVLPLDLFCDLPQALYSPSGELTGVADRALEKLGRSRRVTMTLSTFSAILQTVALSDLIAVVPAHFARSQAERFGLDLYPLPVEIPTARLVMGWHRRTDENPAHKWFRKLISEAALLQNLGS